MQTLLFFLKPLLSQVRVRCDHDAEAPNELSVRENETLTFKSVDEATSWYLVQRAGVPERVQAESGLVPSTNVEVLVDRTHDDHAHSQEAEVDQMTKDKNETSRT